ncbi:MAG: thioredoxin family protein [Pyrinomonadaceae bacterium]
MWITQEENAKAIYIKARMASASWAQGFTARELSRRFAHLTLYIPTHRGEKLVMFKFVAVSLFVLFAGSPVFAHNAVADGVEWQKDYETARALAQQSGKPMLIDFSADWCKPCQEMAKTFWPQPQIVALTRKFVCVSLNFDKNHSEVSRFKVDRIPAVVFTDPWGNVLTNRFGFGNTVADVLPQIMQVIPADFSPIGEWNTALEHDKNNSIALVKLGDFYRKHGILDLSNSYLRRALKTKELEADLKARENILLAVGISCLQQQDYDEAKKTFERCLKEVPNGTHGDTALYGILIAQVNKKKISDAEKTLAQLKSSYPNSLILQQAEAKLQQSKNKQ